MPSSLSESIPESIISHTTPSESTGYDTDTESIHQSPNPKTTSEGVNDAEDQESDATDESVEGRDYEDDFEDVDEFVRGLGGVFGVEVGGENGGLAEEQDIDEDVLEEFDLVGEQEGSERSSITSVEHEPEQENEGSVYDVGESQSLSENESITSPTVSHPSLISQQQISSPPSWQSNTPSTTKSPTPTSQDPDTSTAPPNHPSNQPSEHSYTADFENETPITAGSSLYNDDFESVESISLGDEFGVEDDAEDEIVRYANQNPIHIAFRGGFCS